MQNVYNENKMLESLATRSSKKVSKNHNSKKKGPTNLLIPVNLVSTLMPTLSVSEHPYYRLTTGSAIKNPYYGK